MSGVQFLIDEAGQKTAVVIDLKRNKALWEDFYDTIVAKRRANEPRESLDAVRRKLQFSVNETPA
jgi:hypothetical protein